ncbi:MAG: response regulator, partial [Bacteroidota bacterium]
MKVLILEDESLAADRIRRLIADIDPSIEILADIKSIEEGLAWFEANEAPDLIISDIRLLDGLSFELFKQIKIETPVIFTTAYDQYAIKAFEVNSIDYLLKPIQKEKLQSS